MNVTEADIKKLMKEYMRMQASTVLVTDAEFKRIVTECKNLELQYARFSELVINEGSDMNLYTFSWLFDKIYQSNQSVKSLPDYPLMAIREDVLWVMYKLWEMGKS